MPKVDILCRRGSAGEDAADASHVAIHRLTMDTTKPKPASAFAASPAAAISMSIARSIEPLPKLEIVANFGVGYDGIDLKAAAERGIVVTNTPDVLTEEVADTALGLLLMTVRELSAAERHLRAGKWPKAQLPADRRRFATAPSASSASAGSASPSPAASTPCRCRSSITPGTNAPDVPYRYYADLRAMAADVDTLMIVLPGNAIDHQPRSTPRC